MSESNGESNNGGMLRLIKSWNRVFIFSISKLRC